MLDSAVLNGIQYSVVLVCDLNKRFFVLANEKFKKIITERSLVHEDSASQHRLNQPQKQNAALQSATQVKERISALKKQTKSDTLTADMSLYIYPANGAAAKKVCHRIPDLYARVQYFLQAQLLPLLRKFFVTDPAKDILEYAKRELKVAYRECPAAHNANTNPLNFEE